MQPLIAAKSWLVQPASGQVIVGVAYVSITGVH
jgi:hypothetical protein